MEKKIYSVEWLSESSHRNITYPNVDLIKYRSGLSALQYYKEFSALGMERPNTATNRNEKENHINHATTPYQVQRSQAETHDVTLSRKPLTEVSHSSKSPALEKHHGSDIDGPKSPGSITGDEAMSRPRTKFTREQLQELERSFKEHRYIGSNEKKRLSKVLNLSETQIKTWFQNRRMKFKRQSQDARVEAFFSGIYVPYNGYPEVHNPLNPGHIMPLAPPAPTHPFASLTATFIGPANLPSSMPPANLGPYSSPTMFVHPTLNIDSAGIRYSPY